MSPDESAFCINCGEEIEADTEYCPECGSQQNLDKIKQNQDVTGGGEGGLTSWATGFEPGNTTRNTLVGLGYFFVWPIGIVLLLHGYPGFEMNKKRWAIVGVLILGLIIVGAAASPESPESSGPGQHSADDTDTPSGPEYAVRISYSGSWNGALSVTGGGDSSTKSISGSGTETIEVTGEPDIVSANAQKQDDSSGTLTVEIIHNGEVVAESSTTSAYGVAQTSHSF